MTRARTLADDLNPHIGTTSAIEVHAARIQSLAGRYARIQERWCSEEMTPDVTARLQASEARLEQKITGHVGHLPSCDDGPWRVRFEGDPRGHTVRLITPDGREIGADR